METEKSGFSSVDLSFFEKCLEENKTVVTEQPEIHVVLGSERKKEILKLVCGKNYSLSELADELDVSVPTVKQHISELEEVDLVTLKKDKGKRGPSKSITPSEKILSQSSILPFLKEVPSYPKAWKLVNGYRKKIKSTSEMGISGETLNRLVFKNSPYSYEEVETLSTERKEEIVLDFFGIDSDGITYEIGSWIDLKIRQELREIWDYEGREAMKEEGISSSARRGSEKKALERDEKQKGLKKNFDPLSPPSTIYLMTEAEISSELEQAEINQRKPSPLNLGKGGRWADNLDRVLRQAKEILLLYKFGVYSPVGDKENDFIILETEFLNYQTPLTNQALKILKNIRKEIPEPDKTVIDAWSQTYGKCIDVLEKQIDEWRAKQEEFSDDSPEYKQLQDWIDYSSKLFVNREYFKVSEKLKSAYDSLELNFQKELSQEKKNQIENLVKEARKLKT